MENLTREEIDFIIDALDYAGQNWHTFCEQSERDKNSDELESFSERLDEKLQEMR